MVTNTRTQENRNNTHTKRACETLSYAFSLIRSCILMHIISNSVRVQIGIASPLRRGLVAYPFASNVFKSTKRILKKSRRSF